MSWMTRKTLERNVGNVGMKNFFGESRDKEVERQSVCVCGVGGGSERNKKQAVKVPDGRSKSCREGGRGRKRKRKSSTMGGEDIREEAAQSRGSSRLRRAKYRGETLETGREREWGRTEGGIDGIKKEGLIVNGRVVWKSS